MICCEHSQGYCNRNGGRRIIGLSTLDISFLWDSSTTAPKSGDIKGNLAYRQPPYLSAEHLLLKIINPRDQLRMMAVEIARWKENNGFSEWDSGRTDHTIDLARGTSATFWTPRGSVVSTLQDGGVAGTIAIRARFRDAIDKKYISRTLIITMQ